LLALEDREGSVYVFKAAVDHKKTLGVHPRVFIVEDQ
jgi:hypothetical protein